MKTKSTLKISILLAIIACAAGGLTFNRVFIKGSFIGLWLSPDQQGRYYYEKGDYRAAAKAFENPLWKGIACYKANDFNAAVSQFARVDTPEGYFNLGDAYAYLGKLDQAAKSFSEALRQRPGFIVAKENLALVQSLIQKQKDQKKKRPPEEQELTFDPDQVKFDEKGKKGKKGRIDQVNLTTEQIQQLWMKRLQTTPADFLRMKFAAQMQDHETTGPDSNLPKGR
jgi:Ca-activated chloride channel family protein